MLVSIKHEACRACLPLWLAITVLLAPSTLLAAKILASQALAEGVASGTLSQVKQELLMDLGQKQRYEYDEVGMETLGRSLLGQGETNSAVEILQINQMVHHDSPGAANALADAYRASGDDIQARVFYDMALNMDPDNEHARKASAEQGSAEEIAMAEMANAGGMGDWEMDPEAMQAAMAQMGQEMSPEQMKEMQEAMAQLEAYQQDPSAYKAPAPQAPSRQPQSTTAPTAPKHESEYCEVLHRFNGQKTIEDSQVRTRVEGHYGTPGDTLRTWNVESACGEFLIAVPLWADVSPPVMESVSANEFEDANGGRWVFEIGGDGKATGVAYTAPEGRTTEMKRLGDRKSFD